MKKGSSVTGAHTIVFVHCPVRSGDFAGWLYQLRAIALRNEDRLEFRFLYLPNKVGSGRFIDRFVDNIRFAFYCIREISAESADSIVLFPTFFFPGMTLSCLLLITRRPFVVRLAGREHICGNKLAYFLRKALLRKASAVIALNLTAFHWLGSIDVNPCRQFLVPNPVSREFRAPTQTERKAARAPFDSENQKIIIGAIGSVCLRKGHLELIRATAALGRRDVIVILCGPNDGSGESDSTYAHACRNAAERGGIQLLMLGHVDDARAILWALDIYALPSVSEGMPNSLLEAMGCGLACVASDIDGCRDVIKHDENGMLVRPNDPLALKDALNELIRDRPKRDKLARAAAHSAQTTHAPDVIDAEYIRILTEPLRTDVEG